MTPERIDEIHRLRATGLTPKLIARKLNLRPAQVSEAIRTMAATAEQERLARGELPPLHQCLLDETSARWLLDGDRSAADVPDNTAGLGMILISRRDRGRLLTGTILLDYWCLGAKNGIAPRRLDDWDYQQHLAMTYAGYQGEYRETTLEQMQAIVFGAVEYAAALGFEPETDALKTMEMLGKRPETLLPLTFGRDGKPFFINGPDDDYLAVVQQLEKRVGKGNFKTVLVTDMSGNAFAYEDPPERLSDRLFRWLPGRRSG